MTRWIWIAAAYGASGVMLGAFGAHALEARLEDAALASWRTAVQYQLIHSAVLLALCMGSREAGPRIQLPAWLFSAGILLFCGSIYLLVLTTLRWPGPLTPLGGLCFIAGWASLATLARRD